MAKRPEEWLEIAAPPEKTKGIFKLFLGYAPGVGKTYSMLSEGVRRHNRGEDVVIGVVETHGRKGLNELTSQIEAIPRRKIEYKGTIFEEMDVDAILARKPQVVLVDELAHTNIPGSKHRKRYEDVQEILAAKIDVLSTMNIQHMESIAPTVRAITGVVVRETVPDWVPLMATETVMVDLTPEALQNRMQRGDVYTPDKVSQALKNFFRRGNLIALRELALRQVAEHVDRSLENYMAAKDIHETWPVRETASGLRQRESRRAISRGARGEHGEAARRGVLRRLRRFRREAARGGPEIARSESQHLPKIWERTVARIHGRNIADAVAQFVREKHMTQVIFGRSADQGIRKYLYLSAVNRFLREAPSVDVHIVTQEVD